MALSAFATGSARAQAPTGPAQAIPAAPVPQPAQSNPQSAPVQPPIAPVPAQASAAETEPAPGGNTPGLSAWKGLHVSKIEFEGVTFDPKNPLLGELAQQADQPLDPAKVTASVRRLFASGMYLDIRVDGERSGESVTLIYVGTPRYFVGKVTIDGVKSERLSALLEYATKLDPGTAFSDSALEAGTEGVKQSLADNGYFAPKVTAKSTIDAPNRQVNVTYTVDTGPQARIGNVTLDGNDPGFTPEEFRSKAKLKRGKKVNRDTISNALARLRSQYQKRDRLEATASLRKQTYDPSRKQVDYEFNASEGPIVKVSVEGAKLSESRLKLLVPIYQEGTIDNDLLNEGTFNIQDYLFRMGYFDAKVTVNVTGAGTPSESVIFSVDKGTKRKVGSVTITGNKYFDTDLLKERMQVQKADLYMRNGRYSPALMKADVSSILSLYRANGFNQASISTATKDVDTSASGKKLKVPQIDVSVKVDEGPQQKFGTVSLTGADDSRVKDLQGLMNAQSGQPYSLITLSGDRDTILNYYLSHGFSQARVEVKQHQEEKDPSRMDVTLAVTEGEQVFVDRVLLSGIVHTKPRIVQDQVKVHAGDPLDQSALLDTQRNLYGLALFNEVNTAVQDPDGDDPHKNVLIQLSEARRWDVTYGFGFEAETGTPHQGTINPASAILLGLPPDASYQQNGHTGVSPRVSLDVGRINLRGTDESLTLHTTYGLLEEVATLTFQNPHLRGRQNLSNSISGGYSNVQNITTFQASTLQGDFRISQKVRATDTLIYNFVYRRVAVNPATLQVSANLIPQLSQPVRVGGPGITWFHDTRDPGPLDATRGSYTSVQEFFASSRFGSEANFNRVDVTNSSYYTWGKHKYTLARSTRLGFETVFGANPNVGSKSCVGILLDSNASCNAVPLPERLYAGGATSHRGFGINDAGPRDLQTGYPVGGNGVFVNSTELRLPPFMLPWVGNNLSFVLFHDMGNVFARVSDVFPSFTRLHQPDQQTCSDLGSVGFPFGNCNFNYFSHAVGVGLRYKTPVGPIRLDFSYNLNPPVYPVIYDFNGAPPYEGQSPHFNFFFSIGQAF
ncbi:MAG TPA: POTRA domain-containing protein [Acidobacteriaceae bacterium]|nr:POTRA domain-containing protein [Acidobacteriaceae bacterium]